MRVSLTRQQMFSFTHRPATWQRVALGAAADGTLEAVIHEVIAETSRFEDYTENVVTWSGLLYQCDNVKLTHRVAQLDVYTPDFMRAPGAVWGVYALECAMDELAFKAGIDPIELQAEETTPRRTRWRTSRSRAKNSVPVTGSARRGSAGLDATLSPGQCGRGIH